MFKALKILTGTFALPGTFEFPLSSADE